jgi:hypothetical protein
MRRQISPTTTGRLVVGRERVLEAAYATFTEHGYQGASTLEIASRASQAGDRCDRPRQEILIGTLRPRDHAAQWIAVVPNSFNPESRI